MSILWKYFPRQVGFPNRVFCANKREFLEKVNLHNGAVKRIYYSLYNCNKNNKFTEDTVLIDKIAFDLDNDFDLFALLRLHRFCIENGNLKHIMVFSTKGFWFYIFTKNYEGLVYPKSALENAQRDIANKTKLLIGDPNQRADIDEHVIGDIARIARMPNTYDLTRKLYCIPITLSDIQKGYEFIKQKAKKQCFTFKVYGNNLLDISKYDKKINHIVFLDINFNLEINNNIQEINQEELPPCIKYLLKQPNLGWRGRFHLINFLKEIGLFPEEVKNILKNTLSPQKYYHCVFEERQVDYIFKRDFFVCNKETMAKDGFCFNCEECGLKKLYV